LKGVVVQKAGIDEFKDLLVVVVLCVEAKKGIAYTAGTKVFFYLIPFVQDLSGGRHDGLIGGLCNWRFSRHEE
jgi:hypothetical protein